MGTWTVDFRLNGATLIADSFAVVGVLGDYNRNGVVDAADYVLWRDGHGQSVPAGSSADGNGDGMITAADYDVWRKNFGRSASSGAAIGAMVPEPASLLLVLMACVIAGKCGLTLRPHQHRHGGLIALQSRDRQSRNFPP